MKETIDKHYKIVIIGDLGVGKTSLLFRFYRKFQEPVTLGAQLTFFNYKLLDENNTVRVVFWDLAYYENMRFLSINPDFLQIFFGNSDGIFLVFDLSKRETFENLKKYYRMFKEVSKKRVVGVIVGNKTDLARSVSIEEGKSYAEKLKYTYSEASAKRDFNVQETFTQFLQNLFNSKSFISI